MDAHPRSCDVSEVPTYGPDNPVGYKNLPAFDQAMREFIRKLAGLTTLGRRKDQLK